MSDEYQLDEYQRGLLKRIAGTVISALALGILIGYIIGSNT